MTSVLGVSVPGIPFTDFPSLGKAFSTGFVIEIVEKIIVRRVVAAHAFVLNPVRYTVTEPFEVTLTPTEADTVIEEVNGIIVREITLEGTFGLLERSPKKFVSARPPIPINTNGKADGNAQFKALRDLFREYSAAKKDPTRGPFTKMVFHSLRDDDHWTVVPKSFETPRDAARTRMHYEYRISLLTTGDADKILAVPDSLGLDDVLRVVNQALNEARSFVSDINSSLSQIQRKVANIDAIMINVAGLLTQVGVAVSNGRDLVIDYPKRLARSTTDNVASAADQYAFTLSGGVGSVEDAKAERNLRKLESALNRILAQPHKFRESSQEVRRRVERSYLGERALTEADLETNTGGATANSGTRITLGTESEAGTSFGDYKSLQRVLVTAVTTLSTLATTFNVSRELIVIVNDLKPPYFTRGGGRGTLKPGDFVLIPVALSTGVESGPAPDPAYRDVGQTLYGLDFGLDEEALKAGKLDFKIDRTHGSEDAEYSSGIPNVRNGLEIILHTEQGETQHVPEIGLSLPVGSKGTLQQVLLAATSMRSSILSDDRIEGIVSARLVLEGDVLSQEVTPRIRGAGDGLTVVLPLGQAAGG